MGDDALSGTDHIRAELGWGGPRQRRWHAVGKRAVVHVEPQAYELVVVLARLCSRSIKDVNAQIYALGFETLMGQPIRTLCQHSYEVLAAPPGTPPQRCVVATDEVQALAAQRFRFVPPPAPVAPEPWDGE